MKKNNKKVAPVATEQATTVSNAPEQITTNTAVVESPIEQVVETIEDEVIVVKTKSLYRRFLDWLRK